MEVLRLSSSNLLMVNFSGLIPNSNYYIDYEDIRTHETFSASAVSNESGEVSFEVPEKYKDYDATLWAIVKNYLQEEVLQDSVFIVRPYCNISEVASRLNISFLDAVKLERNARTIIDSETPGFKFIRKEKEVIGNGSDYLPIDEMIYKIFKVYENKELVYDLDSEDNRAFYKLSKDKSSLVEDKDTAENKMNYKFVWRDRYLDIDFPEGFEYLLDAEFGWKVIPRDIQDACEILMSDINSDSFKYIGKYITAFDNEDFKVKFSDGYTRGTGNLVVDKILEKYKNNIRIGVL